MARIVSATGRHCWAFNLSICLILFITVAVADVPFHTHLQSYQDGKLGIQPFQTFHSAPHIKAPIYQVNKFDYEKTDKSPYLFLTGAYNGEKFGLEIEGAREGVLFGPSIVSAKDLSLIWSDENYQVSQVFRPYTFKGQPILATYAEGSIRIYNHHYEQLYVLAPKTGYEGPLTDAHECHITHDDTAVQIFRKDVPVDLTSIGGPAEGDCVKDCLIQEINPATGEVLFQFSTLEHFPVDTTIWPYKGEGVFDMRENCHDHSHLNSIQKTLGGDFLVSYRHLNSVVLIDGKTAEVKWIMGGKMNQFTDITVNGSATFAYQHQPRLTADNRFTLFDNAQLKNGFCPEGDPHCTRGIEIEFDVEAKTMQLVNEWYHPQSIISASRGGIQRLPNGGTMIAWGQNAMYTEHSPDGEVVMDIQRSQVFESDHGHPPTIAYRVWKGDWEGRPRWGPNISANYEEGRKRIYVSWNGATNVEKWILLLSGSHLDLDGHHKVVSELPRLGFETGFDLPMAPNASFARIAALNRDGEIIGSTPGVHIDSGRLHPLEYEISNVRPEFHPPPSNASDQENTDVAVSSSRFHEISIAAESMHLYLASGMAMGFAMGVVFVGLLGVLRGRTSKGLYRRLTKVLDG